MLSEEVEKRLLQKRILVLPGDITEEIVNKLRWNLAILNLESTEEVKLIIDSSGGIVHPALWLYDSLLLSKARVTGIVNGRCRSMALVALQGCHKRLATRHSEFYCHTIFGEINIALDSTFPKRLELEIERLHQSQKYINEILARRTGKTQEQIKNLMNEGEKYGTIISTEKALELNLIDEIIEKYDLF